MKKTMILSLIALLLLCLSPMRSDANGIRNAGFSRFGTFNRFGFGFGLNNFNNFGFNRFAIAQPICHSFGFSPFGLATSGCNNFGFGGGFNQFELGGCGNGFGNFGFSPFGFASGGNSFFFEPTFGFGFNRFGFNRYGFNRFNGFRGAGVNKGFVNQGRNLNRIKGVNKVRSGTRIKGK